MLSNPRADGFNVMTYQKPRVLIFSLAYFPVVGGAEIALKEIAGRLGSPTSASPDVTSGELGAPTHSGVGVDFDLITLRFDKSNTAKEIIGNVNVYRIGGVKWTYAVRAALLAIKLHRRNNYRLVWSVMAAYAGFAALFFKFLNPRVPLLLTLQEGDSEEHIIKRVGILYPLWRLIFKKADYIQAISGYLADFARRHGAECSVEVVPNGVDLETYRINSDASQRMDRSPDQKRRGKTYTIITTSRLVYKNGIDILIRAVSELKAKSYKLKTIIVGDGPDRSKLEKLAVDLNLVDQIKFIGHVEPDLIPRYLAEADIFVRPSRSEGLGNSFLEAMAAGLPVVGTRVGGIPEFIKNGDTGLFCQVNDPKDLADKIVKIFENEDLYRKLSGNGRELIKSKYSWDIIVRGMSRIFVKLLNPNILTSFPKKLLLATGIYPPEIGGPATYAALLEKELPQYGVGVTVLPFRTVRKWPKGLRHFLYFIKVFWLCWKNDLVLAQDTISVGLPSLLAAKLCRKKFIIRVPGDYVWEQSTQRSGVKDSIDDFQNRRYGWRVELLRRIQKFVVGHADAVITPSKYFQRLVSKWVKNPSKVRVIYNGVEISNLKSPAFTKVSAGKQISNRKDKRMIISAGRLVPWKGFGFLIELMKDLPGWKLVIAGDGPEHQNLKSQISNLKLEDRVKLLGQIPREELMEKLQEAEIFILNTHFESFSFQVVEAMSLGLPVVTTAIGNLSEIIENGVDGILVEPNDKKQFLDAIGKLDKDKNFRESISEKAKTKAQRFSIENTVNELVGLLKC